MLPKNVLLRNLAIVTPLALAGLLIVLVPFYSKLHRNPMIRVNGKQTWAVTDPRYPEAYRRAAAALLEANPLLSPDRLGEFDPARVWELGEGRYRIRVAYHAPASSGTIMAKEAECVVRLQESGWTAETAEVIPEFAATSGHTAEIPQPARSRP